MRRVIVTGGPSPMDIRIVDSETEEDLTTLFTGIVVECNAVKLMNAKLTAFAEFDGFQAEVLEPGERQTSLCAACGGER